MAHGDPRIPGTDRTVPLHWVLLVIAGMIVVAFAMRRKADYG